MFSSRSSSPSDEDIVDDDFSIVNLYTNAGKRLEDYKSKMAIDFQVLDNLEVNNGTSHKRSLDSDVEESYNKKQCSKIKADFMKPASTVDLPLLTQETYEIMDVSEPESRCTRSQRKTQKESQPCNPNPNPRKGRHKASKDRVPVSTVTSTIVLSDESEDDFDISCVSEEDPNWEVSVKVRWKFRNIHTFKIRRFQKFMSIFEFFSDLENVPGDQIQLLLNDNIIMPSDTPDSVKLQITNIIDGGVVQRPVEYSNTITNSQSAVDEDSIQLKVCTKDRKEPILIVIKKKDKMIVLMSKISEQIEISQDKLKFMFDGEVLNPSETSIDMDLEGGEMIDLRVASY